MKKKKTIISGTRSRLLDQARFRLLTVMVGFSIGFLMIALRLIDLTLIGQNLSEHMAYKNAEKPAITRANIVDRNGEILATSLQTDSLYADPKMINAPVQVATNLVQTFNDLDYDDILEKLQSKKRFIWIKRNLTPQQKYAANALGHPGLSFKKEWRRFYPQTNLASHLAGYTDIDGNGIAGIEKSFHTPLSNGKDVKLSIDVRLQHVVRRELQKTIKKFSAKGAFGIVMQVKTGEILSMVSLPDFDPHHAQKASADEKFNRNTLGVFEMGSTFKIFSTALALDSGSSKIFHTFDAKKPLKIGRFTIRDYHPKKRVLTLPEVFIHSSNIGSALMAKKIGAEKLQGFYHDLGLMTKSTLEIPEIGTPLIPTPWRKVSTLTASYGHGLAVSPLQTIRAGAAIINGGFLPMPTLLKHDVTDNSLTDNTDLQIISAKTSNQMRQLMELVVTDGTAKKADIKGYRIGGKTGTAEKIGKGGYDREKLLSSFLGAFPMDDPEYILLIAIDEPKGIKETYGYATGGWTATPTAGRIIEYMAPLMRLKPQGLEKGTSRNMMRQYLKEE